MNTTNIGKAKQTESPPADEVIPDTEQLNQDREVTNLEENIPTNEEVVDTPKTDEVSNHDDSTIDNEETEVKADSNPKQSQRQRKGKQRLVNPLSIGDKVRVKDDHYFGGIEGVVTQLATPYTVIVAFDNDERDLIKLTDLDLPTELSKPILINKSKPVKKEILIKEGLNYKAGEGCTWYVEVPEFTYQGLKIYEKRIKCDGLGIGTALTRFLEGEGILIADPTRPLEYIINDEIEENKPESTPFINKSSQRGFLPPDVEIKDSHKKTYCINIGRDTLMKIKKYIEGKPIYTAENAINLLLPD